MDLHARPDQGSSQILKMRFCLGLLYRTPITALNTSKFKNSTLNYFCSEYISPNCIGSQSNCIHRNQGWCASSSHKKWRFWWFLDGSPTITQKSHLQENIECCGGSDGSDGSLPNKFSIIVIIEKVMRSEPAQPSQPSLHLKILSRRGTHPDG